MSYDSLGFKSLHVFLQLFLQINLCNSTASFNNHILALSIAFTSNQSENNFSRNYKHLTQFLFSFDFQGSQKVKYISSFLRYLFGCNVEEQSSEYKLSDNLEEKKEKKKKKKILCRQFFHWVLYAAAQLNISHPEEVERILAQHRSSSLAPLFSLLSGYTSYNQTTPQSKGKKRAKPKVPPSLGRALFNPSSQFISLLLISKTKKQKQRKRQH